MLCHQVLIVHMQYFIIINRINIPWPHSVTSLQAAMSAITGTLTARSLHLGCLVTRQLSAGQQAAVAVATGLAQPILLVVVCCVLWLALRW